MANWTHGVISSTPPMVFADWDDAFAYCHEVDRPIKAQVGNETGRVFPSGYASVTTHKIITKTDLAPQTPTLPARDDHDGEAQPDTDEGKTYNHCVEATRV